MTIPRYLRTTCVLALLCGSTLTAKVSQQEADRLGKDLTPTGAEKAANADGSIPEWTGEKTPFPPGFKVGGFHTNPYADEKPLFVITAANLAQYKDKLSPGQIAMFGKYPDTWQMPVYKTHRSTVFEDRIVQATKKNAVTATLAANGFGMEGAEVGFAFPIPQNGAEVMWNHLTRALTHMVENTVVGTAVTAGGSYTMGKTEIKAIWYYGVRGQPGGLADDQSVDYLAITLAPPQLAGTSTLVKEWSNAGDRPRQAWQYSTGTRRVRRAPNIAFDNPTTGADGLQISDATFGFNGSLERYDWTLVGKKEMYVSANEFELFSPKHKYDEIIKPRHLNPSVRRYELRRVWQVEAKLKSGFSHLYPTRTFYFDEDSWCIAHSDIYDSRGAIWRVQEESQMPFYDIPATVNLNSTVYDLSNGRYYFAGLYNEEKPWNFTAKLNPSEFSPGSLGSTGKR